MLSARNVDATFDQVDGLLGSLGVSSEGEGERSQRRLYAVKSPSDGSATPLTGVRVPFPAMQRIAPLHGESLPDESEFFPVRCHDLATGGISFVMESLPEFGSLVIAMGEAPAITYMFAEVVHCTKVLFKQSGLVRRGAGEQVLSDHPGDPAEPMFLVGCRFTGRRQAGQPEDESTSSD